MPSQLTVVFFVPSKREWLWINNKQEMWNGTLVDDATASERNLKIPKSAHQATSLTKSFFGFSYSQARATEKQIILNYFDSNGIQQQVDHTINCNKKGEGDFQIQLSTRNLPPLWKSTSDQGLVANAEELLPEDEIENGNYNDRETANGIFWPKKNVLWFGICEETGEFWHGALNDENIDAYDDSIKDTYRSMCDSRGVRRFPRNSAVEGNEILEYRGDVEGLKNRVFDGAKLETKMSTGVLEQIKNGETNILLYGPPGTGKTYALQELRNYLSSELQQEAVTIDVSLPDAPLQLSQQIFTPSEMNMPGDIRVWWTTFHQGVTYEDFVVGLRPQTGGGGITLEPRAGILLEAMHHAMGVASDPADGTSQPNTSVIIIDELNRGNVEAILGDFITAMDKDYRAQLKEEVLDYNSKMTIPMIFNNINGSTVGHPLGNDSKKSQPILFASDGTEKEIPLFDGGYIVPQTVIIIGTMNSVDRSIKPLDNALQRRFVQVRCDPDYEVIRGKAANFGSHLLKIANECITEEFPDDGEDKTIGHSLMMKTKTKDLNSVEECYEEWRKHVIPVLIKRFRGKHGHLRTHLQKKFSLFNFNNNNRKNKLPNDAIFEFKRLIGGIVAKDDNHRLCQFVLEMHEGEKGKETVANLIENNVLEDTLFKKGEDEQVLIIQDDTVKFDVEGDDGTITQTTIEEGDWDYWKSVYTEKSLRELMESESEDDEDEDVPDDLTRSRVESDIVLLGVTKSKINVANKSKRRRWRGHLDERTKQLFDEAEIARHQKARLKNYQKERGAFWLNRCNQVVEGGDLSDAKRRLALQAAQEYLAELPAPEE
jgi:DNA polymerase III delta prime subunit